MSLGVWILLRGSSQSGRKEKLACIIGNLLGHRMLFTKQMVSRAGMCHCAPGYLQEAIHKMEGDQRWNSSLGAGLPVGGHIQSGR